jgi:hypothetical protein
MNQRDTSGCSQNPSRITKSLGLEKPKPRSPFFRSLLVLKVGCDEVDRLGLALHLDLHLGDLSHLPALTARF